MSRRRQVTTKPLSLVVFLAGLAFVAVISGYVLERYILGSFIATKATPAKTPQQTVEPQGKTEITIPSTSLWRVQTGVFNSKQSADTQAKQLKAKGFGAYLSGTGNGPFKVVAGVTKTKEAAEKLKANLQKAGFKSPLVSEYKIAAGPYPVALTDAQYVPVFKSTVLTMADQFPQEAGAWDQQLANKKAEFKTTSTTVATALQTLSKKLSTTTPPKGAEALHQSLQALCDKASQNANDIKQYAEKGGTDLYVRSQTSYMEVLESFEKFLAQMPK